MTDPAKKLWYPVWISPGRKEGGWSWGRPCDSVAEASAQLRTRMDEGASLGTVVEFAAGRKTPIHSRTLPPSARKIVERWDDLWEETETDPG